MSYQARSFYIVFVYISCFLMPNAGSEILIFNNMTTERSASLIDSITEVNCGETQKMVDMCFKDLPPHLMEFLTTTKIAVNKDEIISKCTVFKRGMKCFDSYTDRCLSKEKNFYLQNNVAGARRFLTKFCEDRRFQSEYIRHKECFSHIQEDWNRCTKDFQSILADELHGRSYPKNITSKFMQFCCARHAYENCIYTSARFKCYKHSAKFARETAKMLSEEKLFSNCKKYENLLCAAPGIYAKQNESLVFVVVSFVIAVLWRRD